MGLKEAVIYLDNQWNTYYAGQTVNGRIEYVFDSPKKVRGIHVKIKGEAHTEWSESKQEENAQGKTESTDTLHTGNEEYFQISYYLLGSNTGSEIEIPSGKQVYNFTCTLPPVLPSSFEGQFGYIRYTVKVTLDRPWKFDQETKMAFTVINALDLNLNTSYKEPIHFQMEKTFCCFCCASPPLSVDVRAPVSGYCPGQTIPLTIDIENKSNVQLHLVKIFLRKVVNYRSTTPSTSTKKTKDVILTVQEGPAPEGTTKHWNLTMEIPPIPPSNLVNCNIIDLDYDLKVQTNVLLNEEAMEVVESTVVLRITVDAKLQWGPHIAIMSSKLSSAAFAIKKIRSLTDENTAKDSLRDKFKIINVLTVAGQYIFENLKYVHKNSDTVIKHSDIHNINTRNKHKLTLPVTRLKKVECVVSGMHFNMKDRKYITIGTVPLMNSGQPLPSPSAPMQPIDISPNQPAVLPVGPGEPAMPSNVPTGGDAGPGGWMLPGNPTQPPYQSLYPTLSQPVYKESLYSARTIQDRGESNNMAITGNVNFAPYYPTYAWQPPPLPQ